MSGTADPLPTRIDHRQLAADLVARARAEGVDLLGPGRPRRRHLPQRHPDQDGAGRDRPGADRGAPGCGTPGFEPVIVRTRQRRLTGVDQIVLSPAARGLTTGEIAAHFDEIYGATVSKDTISRITDKVVAEMADRRSRPPAASTR